MKAAIALVFLIQSLGAQSLFNRNLMVNSDAEGGTGSASSGTVVSSIPGWTATGSANVVQYSGTGVLDKTTIGPVNRGTNYFMGGPSNAKSVLTQKIDLSGAASGIDAGAVSYDISGFLGGEGKDASSMIVTFQGASGNTLATITLGPVGDPDKREDSALYLRRQIGLVPTGTRSANVELDLVRDSGTANHAAADNLSLVLNGGPTSLFSTNLIVNGNAEAPTGAEKGDFPLEIPGWVRTAGFSVDRYDNGGGDLDNTSPGPSDRGAQYFFGGLDSEVATATQDIDLSAGVTQIDTGKATYNFSGWIGGYSNQHDNLSAKIEFRNWAGAVLGSAQLGPVSPEDRSNNSALLSKSQTGTVPAGTRYARITMTSTRTDGSDNDGLADSLSLVLTAPATGSTPSIQSGGVVTATAFGGSKTIAPGTWIEIYGSNLATDTRSWAGADFNGTAAPTALNGTSVTIGGQRGFVSYISPGQVNVQVPSNVAPGTQNLVVSTPNGDTAAFPIAVAASQPGLLAPASFVIGGKQYLAALHTDGTFVLPPGSIVGLPTRQAQPGETILVYGIGFGPVTPSIAAGQIVTVSNQVSQPLTISFGGTAASLPYEGLAPNFVGLYQFNVVVPNVSDNDALPLTFTLGGTPGTQTLVTAVKR